MSEINYQCPLNVGVGFDQGLARPPKKTCPLQVGACHSAPDAREGGWGGSLTHRGEISEACQQQEKCVSTAECHIGGVRKPMNM